MKKLFYILFAFVATPAFSEDCDFEKQVEVLALNMYHEARNQGIDGMQMVGEVTLTRVESPRYPDTICEVVYQKSQFSWTKTIRNHTPKEQKIWEESVELATNLILGEIEYFENGATHFLNPKKVKRIPTWAKKFEVVGKIKDHVFYREG